MYALRAATGTVPSIPLITASILSKKLGEGIEALVFDVKFGSAAFMQTREQARELAGTMKQIASESGVKRLTCSISTVVDFSRSIITSNPLLLGQLRIKIPPGASSRSHCNRKSRGENRCSITSKLASTSMLPSAASSSGAISSTGFSMTRTPRLRQSSAR